MEIFTPKYIQFIVAFIVLMGVGANAYSLLADSFSKIEYSKTDSNESGLSSEMDHLEDNDQISQTLDIQIPKTDNHLYINIAINKSLPETTLSIWQPPKL